jgi:subtilisin family serine protease
MTKPGKLVPRLAAFALVLVATAPARSQILGGRLPSLPLNLPQPELNAPGLTGQALQDAEKLVDQRQARLANLIREHRDQLEADEHGNAVVRGEVVALSPGEELLKRAEAAGFRVGERNRVGDLDLEVVTLEAPQGVSAREALRRLKKLDPKAAFELDHLYEPSGVARAGAEAATAAPLAAGARVGMVDMGVPANLPALRGSRVEARSFVGAAVAPRDHGAEVASLLVGREPPFRGSAPGAELFAADVYGAGPIGGTSVAIVRALGWLAENHTPVINMSLAGPDDLTLRTAVERLVARGYLIVAAAGNDGPAAPPAYPASYPGVVSVTGVDAHGRVLPEAGRPTHIDFAAPGADMGAASLSGWAGVRGTSFASPLVAGRLADLLNAPDPAGARRAREELARTGKPVSVGGRKAMLVGEDLRFALSALPR